MKKILIISLVLFSVLSIKNNVYATVFITSGACFSHGGVNCSAGASPSGSVICNDSYIDTNFIYTDLDECNANAQGCTSDEYQSLRQKYGVNDKTAQLNSINAQTNSIVEQMKTNLAQLQTLLDKINNVQSDRLNEITSSGGIVNQSQLNGDIRSELNSISSQRDSLNSQNLKLKNQISQLKNSSDQLLNELSSSLSKVKDDCHNLGLTKKVPQPQPISQPITINTNPAPVENINPTDHCIAVWGAHTHPSSDTSNTFTKVSGCACDSGYIWTHFTNKTVDKCVAVSSKKTSVNTSTPLTTNTVTPTSTTTSATPIKQKHWYSWLNPFSWFK
jgi:hypothetical protein